jgi:hypothetical protein
MARENSFDELARGLAAGSVPRGKALKLMGAALVGGVLASIPRAVVAAPRCKQPSACCTCSLQDRTTFQEVARKCYTLRTADPTCSAEERSRLQAECNARCAKLESDTLFVGQAGVGCTVVGTPDAQSTCQKTTTPGVSGTECALDQTCTSRA